MHGLKDVFDALTSNRSLVLSNWALFLVGVIAGRIALRSLGEVKEQGKIASATLVTQFRPRLVVRKIELSPPLHTAGETNNSGNWRIAFSLINTGGTNAHIRSWDARLYWDKRDDTRRVVEICAKTWQPIDMPSGDRRQFEMLIPSDSGFKTILDTEKIAVLERYKEQMLFPTCSGIIHYEDDNKVTRQTGFERSFDLKDHRFVASTNSDEEFTD
jgi:hypothetical protein